MVSTIPDLGQISLFAGLSQAAQEALSAVATVRTWDDGQVVMLEGDGDTPVFFVLQGSVRVFRTNLEGREQTLIRLHPGDALNIPAAFVDDPLAHASVVAVDQVRLLSIPRAAFRRLVSETPELSLAVLRDLSLKLGHLADLTHDLGLRTVRARLARFLLAHARADGETMTRWTHEAIATEIGTVREVVSRTLRAFVRDGLVEVQRHRILVRDPEALADEAQG